MTSPVTVPEALDHLRLPSDVTEAEYAEVQRMLNTATEWCERFTRRRWAIATVSAFFTRFPTRVGTGLYLPGGPVSQVNSVTYYDSTPTQQTWSGGLYRVSAPTDRSYLRPAFGEFWPTDCANEVDNIEVSYDVGLAAVDVPDPIKSAILLVTGSLYEYREEGVIDNAGLALVRAPMPARSLLMPFKVSL